MHDEEWFTVEGRAKAAALGTAVPNKGRATGHGGARDGMAREAEATDADMEAAAAECDEAGAGVLPTHPLSSCLLIPCTGRRPRGPGPGLGARRVRGPGYPGPGCGLGASLAILCRYLIRRPAGRVPGAGGGWPGVGDIHMTEAALALEHCDHTQPPPKVVPDRRRIPIKSRGKLNIFTIGHYSMGMSYVDHEAIQLWFQNAGYASPNIVENCKHLGEAPDSDSVLIRHPGFHCDNIMHLSREPAFQALIAKLAPSISNHLAACQKLTIVLVCRHGRHRSVAVATVLQSLVRYMFGIETCLVHLGKAHGTWDKLQCDGSCDSCAWKALAPLDCVRPRALGPVPGAWAPGPPNRARAPGPFPGPRPRPRPPGPGPRVRAPAPGARARGLMLAHPLRKGAAGTTMARALGICLETWTTSVKAPQAWA